MDASNSGLGAALLQEGKPCEKFHQYVYGNKSFIESDHKPLDSIIKKLLARAPMRLQSILLCPQNYDTNGMMQQ